MAVKCVFCEMLAAATMTAFTQMRSPDTPIPFTGANRTLDVSMHQSTCDTISTELALSGGRRFSRFA